ncbi:MAG: pectate lyase [Parvularculaceae bacterium]
MSGATTIDMGVARGGWVTRALLASAAVVGLAACGRDEAPAPAPPAEITAFPGAEGFGRHARGGRGGDVMFVTTLAEEGPGSLRACVEADRPRVCVFRVGGVIRYEKTRPPIINNPFITIAGQTAPGGGVLITHSGGDVGFTPITVKNTNDVVVRHVRVRADKRSNDRNGNDAVVIENSVNVVIDHVSTSWAEDENINGFGDNDNVTISWSIFAEGLQDHDKCALLGGKPIDPQHISFVRNLCAHNGDRNPDANFPPQSCIEVVNNVIYHGKSEFLEVWETYGGTPISVVGNYFKAGPETPTGTPAVKRLTLSSAGRASIYLHDNHIDAPDEDGLLAQSQNVASVLVDAPTCPLAVTPTSALEAYVEVLDSAGAMPRDSFAQRIVSDVRLRSGSYVNKPGVLPAIAGRAPPEDLDSDGMADSWERINGADEYAFDAWDDADGDGWTNLDEYLDYAHRQLLANHAQKLRERASRTGIDGGAR